jgi:hypothetical protein
MGALYSDSIFHSFLVCLPVPQLCDSSIGISLFLLALFLLYGLLVSLMFLVLSNSLQFAG